MGKGIFRFYEELNDLLTRSRRKRDFEVELKGKRSIKDIIEALGVPHTEVDLILVNRKSVGFNYIPLDGDRVSIYPAFESLNIENVTHLRKTPLRITKFIADINLKDIVRYMRAMGLDVYFDPTLSTRQIIEISNQGNRIILTKGRKLLKFKEVTHGILIRPGSVEQQIRRVIGLLDIRDKIRPFSRCLRCNSLLESVPMEQILDRIPQKTKAFCHEYMHCKTCDKIYWKGTHFARINNVICRILAPPGPRDMI
ncbi:MAG TPA: twitching motility protein PilT [Desulfobacteraceae bacterium]|nr:twitching motility protein PilT [Desulfobacteraceae bacterium]